MIWEHFAVKTTNDDTVEEEEPSFSKMLALFLIAVILAIAFGIYYAVGKYVKRHTGVYETKEDAGEHDATDADTAVLHSKTGHLVEKKQEWFI